MKKKRTEQQKSAEITPEMHRQYREYHEALKKFTVAWNMLLSETPPSCITCSAFESCDYFQKRNEHKTFCGKKIPKEERI